MYTDRNLQRYTHLSATQIHRSTLPLHKHLCTYTPHTHTASCIQLRAWELTVPCLVQCGALGLSPRPHHPGRVLGTEGAACPVLQSAGRYSASKSGFSPGLSLPQSPPAPPKPRPLSTQIPQLLHCPISTHTPGLTPPCPAPAPARGPSFCSPGYFLAEAALQTWPQSRAHGSSSKEPGPALRGHCYRVIHRSCSPVLEAPTYLWEWQVGAGPARRPHGLCLSRTRSPHLHPASWGWINGPEPWPECLALVLCGLWPQAPWACCSLQDSTVLCSGKQSGGKRHAVPPRPAPPCPVGTLEAGGQVQEI